MQVRPLSAVPKPAMLLLALGLCAQLCWYFSHPPTRPSPENLPQPPSLAALQLASLGEPIGLSKILLLYLQSFDDQPGVSAAFRKLDYPRMQTWLELTLQLDPAGQYPLFLASHIYGGITDPVKQRQMFNFVYQQFFIDPNRRWESLAFAAITTEHKLNDLAQAQKYAQALRLYTTASTVPDWAKQMDIFMLEDMAQYKQASTILTALLASGQITDKYELVFLNERLEQIKAKARSLE